MLQTGSSLYSNVSEKLKHCSTIIRLFWISQHPRLLQQMHITVVILTWHNPALWDLILRIVWLLLIFPWSSKWSRPPMFYWIDSTTHDDTLWLLHHQLLQAWYGQHALHFRPKKDLQEDSWDASVLIIIVLRNIIIDVI